MRTIIPVLFALSIIVTADTLWEWDMTELPSGWTANSFWQFDTEGAHSFVSSSGLYGENLGTQQSLMVSDTLTVPDGTDNLYVGLETDWDYDGWWSTGESNCMIWFSVEKVLGDWWIVVFDSHSWGFDGPISFHDDATTVMIPLTSGDQFYLKFRSSASSTFSAYAEMDWDVSDVFITDQGGAAIEATTWGALKNLF